MLKDKVKIEFILPNHLIPRIAESYGGNIPIFNISVAHLIVSKIFCYEEQSRAILCNEKIYKFLLLKKDNVPFKAYIENINEYLVECVKENLDLINKESEIIFAYNLENLNVLEIYISSNKYKFFINFHERMYKVIEQVLVCPEMVLSKINVLDSKEIKKINFFNQTNNEYGTDSIIDFLVKKVYKNRNMPVLYQCNKPQLTYMQMYKKIISASMKLRALDIKKGDIVGLWAFSDMNVVILFFAILNIGAIYLPLSSDFSIDYVNKIILDSNMKVLIYEKSLRCADIKGRCIELRRVTDDMEECEDCQASIVRPVELDDPAYIIYTSGTTGYPKGVYISHRGLSNLLYYLKQYFSDDIKTVLFSDISFDASIWDILMGVLVGRGLLVLAKDEKYNLAIFEKRVQEYEISLLTLPTYYANQFDNVKLPGVKVVIFAGSKLTKDILKKWNNERLILNAYGATENTICATVGVVQEEITIGKPIANTQIYILNDNLQLQGIYMYGEICICGDLISVGYVNRNENLNKFVNLSYISEKKIYRTGDIGYWNEQGEIVYVGRLDRQIKHNGFRIELDQIECMLLEMANISNCAVVYVQNCICALYEADKEISTDCITRFLINCLPQYMLPHFYYRLPEILYNTNSKKDYMKMARLVEEYIIDLKIDKEVKSYIRDIFEEELNSKSIDDDGNFFLCGGNSIKAVKIIMKLENKFDVKLKVTDLYLYPSINTLKDYLCRVIKCK